MRAAPSVSGRHPKTFTGADICSAAKKSPQAPIYLTVDAGECGVVKRSQNRFILTS
jgi:hypothetical protein